MVRTVSVVLETIKAIACRQKLPTGGSGIVIIREDTAQPGIASISKTSGEAIPTPNTSKKLFPLEAFREAIAKTAGLPFKKRGSMQLNEELKEKGAHNINFVTGTHFADKIAEVLKGLKL